MRRVTVTVSEAALMRVLGGAIGYRDTKLKRGGKAGRSLNESIEVVQAALMEANHPEPAAE